MQDYIKKPESQSRTLDSNPKASRQAPIDVILQRYGERSIQQYADNEELTQGGFESAITSEQEPMQREKKPNNTGLPDNLKTGIENLSGYSMDDVKVHYNSDKPMQLNALAYTQGADIYIASGQEKHLPHEAWHVVQQKYGRVSTNSERSIDENIENEATVMGKLSLKQTNIHDSYSTTHLKANTILFAGRIRYKRLPHEPLTIHANLNDIFNQFLATEDEEFGGTHAMGDYSMGGEQQASTTLSWSEEGGKDYDDFTVFTFMQKHSEMMAIERGIREGTLEITEEGKITYTNGETVRNIDMETPQPHCRFCTFFLGVLGIERGTPTTGNFNLARNLDYPLPEQIKGDRRVINNVATVLGLHSIDDFLRAYLPTRKNDEGVEEVLYVFDEDNERQADFINLFWKSVFNFLGGVK